MLTRKIKQCHAAVTVITVSTNLLPLNESMLNVLVTNNTQCYESLCLIDRCYENKLMLFYVFITTKTVPQGPTENVRWELGFIIPFTFFSFANFSNWAIKIKHNVKLSEHWYNDRQSFISMNFIQSYSFFFCCLHILKFILSVSTL